MGRIAQLHDFQWNKSCSEDIHLIRKCEGTASKIKISPEWVENDFPPLMLLVRSVFLSIPATSVATYEFLSSQNQN